MKDLELKSVEKLEVVPVDSPVEWDDVKEFREVGCILSIQPPKTKKKKIQNNIVLEPPIRRGDISLLNYVYSALITTYPKLIEFAWNNKTVKLLARHYHLHRTSSTKTLARAVFFINSFSEFVGLRPDEIISSLFDSEGNLIPKALKKLKKDIEEWQAELKGLGYAPNSIKLGACLIKTWLDVNGVEIGKIPKPQSYIKYPIRAFTTEQIQRLMDIADLQGKVMISILATSGIRVGTLARLKYKHVKDDLEAGITPVCIHIKADETKGKYTDYFTFINDEAVGYLKLYLEERRRGTEKIPPEEITDESPLIRDSRSRDVKPIKERSIYMKIHRLMHRAGLIKWGSQRRHELNAHSLRKWFKTQLTAKGVHPDYVEFMMGHKISTYNDVKSLGVEKLREIYKRADLRIRPRPEISKLEQLKAFALSLGLDPDKIINEKAILEPHRTIIGEEAEMKALQEAIRDTIAEIVMKKIKQINTTPD